MEYLEWSIVTIVLGVKGGHHCRVEDGHMKSKLDRFGVGHQSVGILEVVMSHMVI